MTSKTYKSYEEYLAEQKSKPSERFYDSLRKIEKEFQAQRSTYGTNAESLGEKGLSGSGYAAFLDAGAMRSRKAKQADAASTLLAEQAEQKSGYQSYLTNEKKRLYSLERSVQSSILASETVDSKLALEMARGAGLSDEHARAVAKRAVALNVNKKKFTIMNYIRKQMISPANAVLYGEAYGLPEYALKEIYDYAVKLEKRGDEIDLEGTLESYPTVTPE